MELSSKNFKKILSTEIIKKAQKNTVRECDEIEKGHFQAYVDDKKETYDTLIVLDDKGNIKSSQSDCDCLSEFCQHKASLLLFLAKEQQVVAKAKTPKKESQALRIINDMESQAVKDWLIELLRNNKEVELNFLHQFSSQKDDLKPEDVRRLTIDAVKSVVNNRRKVEIGEVKKIVDLWTVVHKSVTEKYILRLSDEAYFKNFHTIIEACEDMQLKLSTSSTRFVKYIENLLSYVLLPCPFLI